MEHIFEDMTISSALAFVIKTAGAPFQRVRLATYDRAAFLSKAYNDAIRQGLRDSGIAWFWRGNLVNCMRYVPGQAIPLSINGPINAALPRYHARTDFWPSLFTKMLAGGLSGIVGTALYPADQARLSMSATPHQRQFNGANSVALLWRRHGFSGLYAGWPINAASSFVFRAGQLGLFAQIQELQPYTGDKGAKGVGASFAAATTARTLILPFCVPFDAVRAMMMEDLVRSSTLSQPSGFGRLVHLLVHQPRVLFRGLQLKQLSYGVPSSLLLALYERVHVVYNL
jgi:solute carrier family 25 (adenine nucleotide translocator) protein 4/5/6/31